jgi:arginyl-tRNA synthetase
MNVLQELQRRFHDALTGLVADPAPYAALVKPAQNPQFGDYQANGAMPLAKALGKPARAVAEDLAKRLDLGDLLEPPEVAGPGFINLRLRADWLAKQARAMAADDRLGVAPVQPAKTFVLDYSSPNVAKPMHVGHLRSTIIGDALARLMRFLGHKVITDNHLGDWGLQFGMLLYGYKHLRDDTAYKADPVRELARLYVEVRSQFSEGDEEDEEDLADPVLEACRRETAKLHAGDPENLRLWREFMPACLEEINRIYRRLGVQFDHMLGESFYNPQLPQVVDDLLKAGVACFSKGAVVIPPADAAGDVARWLAEEEARPPGEQREGPPPAIVRKGDGAFTYTATDLATVRYRVEKWNPHEILYVVDFRQRGHFLPLFDAARRWGFTVGLEHVSFGAVTGKDRRPLKTREGGVPELNDLLDDAVRRAGEVYAANRQERLERGEEVPELSPRELAAVNEAVGVGAVKYADLSQNRTSDYAFDVDKMTATDGNTATYMQYAYARNRSIFRKGNEDPEALRREAPAVLLRQPEERALAAQLLRFSEALDAAAAEYKPSFVTAYLWDLAKTFSGFFQNCPVLKAETPELRRSRLLLCDLTARVIQRGLDLLGIRTVERM